MESTVGGVLYEKMHNMSNWLQQETQQARFDDGKPRDVVAATLFADHLAARHRASVERRDFAALLTDEKIPHDFAALATEYVVPRADLHDKFWRYMELFINVASSSDPLGGAR